MCILEIKKNHIYLYYMYVIWSTFIRKLQNKFIFMPLSTKLRDFRVL